jgi:hypothetical protein
MKKQGIRKIGSVLCCLSIVFFFSCGGGGSSSSGGGVLSVNLTDTPALFSGVYVTISSVRVHTSAGAEGEDTSNAEESGWREVPLNANLQMPVNLLDLQDASVLLAEGILPAGHYQQIRLVLEENTETELYNYVVLEQIQAAQTGNGGEQIPLKTPSAQQSGLKLINQFTVEEGMITQLLIDFDAEQSVVETGNGKFNLKPVLRVEKVTIGSDPDAGGEVPAE